MVNFKELAEFRVFSKIVGFLCLVGIFYMFMTQSAMLGEETIKNVVFMVVGGAVTVLFGSKD